MNCEGQKGIDNLNEGVNTLRQAIISGDIARQSSILKNVGSAGLRKLKQTTHNICLKRVFDQLANNDEEIGDRLNSLSSCDAKKAAEIVCNLLDYKARQYLKCLK